MNGVPKGSRTPVAGMKTRCPRPLDDGDLSLLRLSLAVFGGARRDRTADLLHAMQALSQLSYSPEFLLFARITGKFEQISTARIRPGWRQRWRTLRGQPAQVKAKLIPCIWPSNRLRIA